MYSLARLATRYCTKCARLKLTCHYRVGIPLLGGLHHQYALPLSMLRGPLPTTRGAPGQDQRGRNGPLLIRLLAPWRPGPAARVSVHSSHVSRH
jgi:hypothetical protein